MTISKNNKTFGLVLLIILLISFLVDANNMTSFELICSTKYGSKIPVQKYRSKNTGLTVILGDVPGPDVNGFFLLATEAHDDDGLPHTLEHIVFLGSEQYPFKGVLDLLANRCLASGTNAWTDSDHTCYTLNTVGSEGFLSLLPIYLDHILYPTITDAGFITEVHHISGDGENSGVVYSEMQGRENTGESRGHRQMIKAMFPDSGYSSETGGILHNLRTSTTNQKVRDYHKEFYRPENLFVIITGQISPDDVFEALQVVEDRIMEKGPLPPFQRPWQSPITPLESSKDFKIYYPSDEEDCGLVMISWRGPKTGRAEMLSLTACSIMLRYLADTSVSPLQRELVEIEDPYASNTGYDISEMKESMLYLTFKNVPVEKIDKIYDKLVEILDKIASGEERIDMERMRSMIDRSIMESWSSLENSPHDAVSFNIIGDCLYGDSDEEFIFRLDPIKQFEEIREYDESFWVGLIKKYLIDGHHVLVKSVPSIEEQKRNALEELERIEKQRKELGEDGLRQKEKELMEAMATNEIPPPIEMLTQMDIPGTEGIKFHSVKIYREGEGQNPPGFNLELVPVYAEAYDVQSNFVYLISTINTSNLSRELRPYVLLFLELLMESPVRKDGVLIPYEKVVAALQTDTVSSGVELGLESTRRFNCGPFSYTASILLQIEPKKYVKGVNWMIDLLHNTEFLVDRIRVCAAKMANDVAQAKRRGDSIAMLILKTMFYNEDSNLVHGSMLRQHKFLTTIMEQLDNPVTAQVIIDNLNELRANVTSPSNLAIHVATDWKKLSGMEFDLNEPWKKIVKEEAIYNGLNIHPDWKIINLEGKFPDCSGSIVGMGCVESAFLFQASPCLNDFMDPDLPALMLFLQYLTQLEGSLWKQIRGQGLAYGYHIVPRPDEGLLFFSLYRAANLVAAYKEAKIIIEAQLTETAVWDQTLLESAKSSLIFEIIEREKSLGDLVVQSFLSSFKQVPVDYNRILVKRLSQVTEADLLRVGKLYVSQIFSNKAKTSIVCHPDKVKDISVAFNQMGYNMTTDASLEESFLGKC